MRDRGRGEFWSVVLAAGDGSRLAPLTRKLYGDERPKQFARLGGGRTLLQETVARQRTLIAAERTVVVVPARYQGLAAEQLSGFRGIDCVAQPRNVGTGPGLLLPLARVLARAPEATVLVAPSDHHYRAPRRLLAAVRAGAEAAAASASGVCLLGAEAEHPATDLGWIVPGAAQARGKGSAVTRFVEKPSAVDALALQHAGALWNTFVMVGAAERFWALGLRHLPRQAALFERYRAAVDTAREEAVLAAIYRELEPADFSRQVLAAAAGLALVPLRGSGWSDWGTPERLMDSLAGSPALADLRRRLAAGPRPAQPHPAPAQSAAV
jgi:mannose-1-phosphate guanylyltransferase